MGRFLPKIHQLSAEGFVRSYEQNAVDELNELIRTNYKFRYIPLNASTTVTFKRWLVHYANGVQLSLEIFGY